MSFASMAAMNAETTCCALLTARTLSVETDQLSCRQVVGGRVRAHHELVESITPRSFAGSIPNSLTPNVTV